MVNKLFIVVQARMTSIRLPQKVMLPLCEKSVLGVLLERLSRMSDNIVVATTDDGNEQPIVEICEKLGVKYFRGSESDVLGRFYHATLAFGAKGDDTIVRVCSDSPLIDASVLEKLINFYTTSDFQYVSNLGGHYPNGLEAEVFSFGVLCDAYKNATADTDREHVTPYIRRKYQNGFFDENERDYSRYKLTIDTNDDYLFLQKLLEALECDIMCDYAKLTAVLESGF